MAEKRTFIAIDLKSFYASVECQERGLDPLDANLTVADESRTEKTICLAVSPALKKYGISSRARLFEVVQRVRQINRERREAIRYQPFRGTSIYGSELEKDPYLEMSYITAVPRMALYIEYSTRVYSVYLKYISPQDIHVYSIDEVFMDVTGYLNTYGMSAHELAVTMIRDVLKTTGITATAGIGENLYLAKVAMDIVAKHMPADEDGVRIAELSEKDYRRWLWTHRPLTDFWRVGRGTAAKLEANGMYTMGDVARCALQDEDLLYRLFGVNAEFLIDHAFGYEDTQISEIKSYRPESSSVGAGQVLMKPYSKEMAGIIVREMTDSLILDLVSRRLMTDAIVLTIGYDRSSLCEDDYEGKVTSDWYGRKVPAHAHGTARMKKMTSSSRMILDEVMRLYDRITDPSLLIRRVSVTACNVTPAEEASDISSFEQISLFSPPQQEIHPEMTEEELEKEHDVQKAILEIRRRFGNNSIIKGTSLQDGSTAKQRAQQIGGHKS